MAKCSDAEFSELFKAHGAAGTARALGIGVRRVYNRRRRIEGAAGMILQSPNTAVATVEHPQRIQLSIRNGVVLVGSDGHYWPNVISTAHKAFVKLCKELKPSAVIMNGDAFDGASISRHPPIGWEDNPSVQQEIEAVKDRLGEIEFAAGRARKIWPLGNHDARFETRLASVAPEYAKVHGVHLSDHFPLWEGCWSCWINDDVVIKHRFRGGVHATHNNTLHAGRTMVTGHLHSLKVTPFSDYNGDRFGVDTGCLADPYGPQFRDYTEDSPRNHRSGFVVLTFIDGKLLWPEVVNVIGEGKVGFRGRIVEVRPCTARSSTTIESGSEGRATSTRRKNQNYSRARKNGRLSRSTARLRKASRG